MAGSSPRKRFTLRRRIGLQGVPSCWRWKPVSRRLQQLAALHGIAAEYRDIWDNVHRVGDETLRALLAAMGIDASTDKAVDEALIRTNAARWGRVIDAAIVVREGAAAHIELRLPAKTADATLAWKIVAEDGREWRASFDARALRKSNAVTIARRRCVARELP